MDSLVSRVLSKYFKRVVKDFKKEQFKCSLLKGSAELTNSSESHTAKLPLQLMWDVALTYAMKISMRTSSRTSL